MLDSLTKLPGPGSKAPDALADATPRTCSHTHIGALRQSEKVSQRAAWPAARRIVALLVESRAAESLYTVIVIVNACLIIYETDQRAAKEAPASWQRAAEVCFAIFYGADVVLQFYIQRWEFFEESRNVLDLMMVLSDLVSEALLLFVGGNRAPSFGVLRVCRIFRLLRFVHCLALFRELHIMLTGFVSAARAMVWASFMLIMLITLWSIVAVEVLNPVNERIGNRGDYEDCDRCKRAFSSVFASNLTFLQQVIAGDSWGVVSIPIIEESPATAAIFYAVLITVNLGLLNLILTVIVDVAQRSREADDLRILQEKSLEFVSAKKQLYALCQELDHDDSGSITYDEFMDGYDTNPRFSAALAVLEVSADELQVIYNLLDEDKSGSVSYQEFIDQMHKLKSQGTHSMLVFLKAFLQDVRKTVEAHFEMTKDEISVQNQEMLQDVKRLLPNSGVLQSSPVAPSGIGVWTQDLLSALKKIGPSSSSLESSQVHVRIEGARGLRTADSVGASSPYCVCEILGKPGAAIKSHLVEDSLDPQWQYEDDINGFSAGDALMFTVWGRDALQDDYCLGKAVLTAEDLAGNGGGFDGELQLYRSGEHTAAALKVQVSGAALLPTSMQERNLELVGVKGPTSRDAEGRSEDLELVGVKGPNSHAVEGRSEGLEQRPESESFKDGVEQHFAQQVGQSDAQVEDLEQSAEGSVDGPAAQSQNARPAWWSLAIAESVSKLEAEMQQLVQRLESELAQARQDMKSDGDGQTLPARGCAPAAETTDLGGPAMPGECERSASGPELGAGVGGRDTDLKREACLSLGRVSRV